MKRFATNNILTIAACFILVLGMVSYAASARDRYEEKFDKTEALAKDGKVIVRNVSGDITVESWNQDQVKIDALKVSEAASEEKAKENAQEVKIEVTKEGNTLRIETKYPREKRFWGHNSMNVSVTYKIFVPEKASVDASSVSGDVDAANIGGSVQAGTVSGDATLRKAAAGAECKSVSGDVTAEDVTGDVYLKTVSGDAEAKRIKGSIDAESVSGGVVMTDVSEAKTVSAKTVSGEVEYRGKISPQGRYTLKSHSGDVTMVIPADSAFEFEAETFSGVIDSEFPIEVSGKVSPRELRGTVNKGGAVIRLSAFSGSVELKKG